MPGTSQERPNWRRKAKYTFEQFSRMPHVLEALADLDVLRKAQESRASSTILAPTKWIAHEQPSLLTDDDLFLFNEGTHYELWKKLGSHLVQARRRGRRLFRRVGPQCRARRRHRRLQRLGQAKPSASAARQLGHLGRLHSRHRARAPATSTTSRRASAAIASTRPIRSPSATSCRRGRPHSSGTSTTSGTTPIGWPNAAAASTCSAPMSIYEMHLGSWRRNHAENSRWLTYRELAYDLAEHVQPHGLHARRVPAGDGAPVLRLLGLSNDRLLRSHQPLRHAAGFQVPRRLSASAGHRRDPRLGALALSARRARPRVLRRHAPLRALRPAATRAAGLEQLRLQLRPQRSSQLSH